MQCVSPVSVLNKRILLLLLLTILAWPSIASIHHHHHQIFVFDDDDADEMPQFYESGIYYASPTLYHWNFLSFSICTMYMDKFSIVTFTDHNDLDPVYFQWINSMRFLTLWTLSAYVYLSSYSSISSSKS